MRYKQSVNRRTMIGMRSRSKSVRDGREKIGRGGAQRGVERRSRGRDGVKSKAVAGCGSHSAGEDVDAFAERQRARGDGAGAFAGKRTFVEAAFAGDDEVRRGEARIEIEPRSDKIESRQQLPARGNHEAERNSAGGAGAGRVHKRVGLLAMRAEHEREARAVMIEAREVGGPQAFLRTVNRGGAAWAEERISHVARDANRRE